MSSMTYSTTQGIASRAASLCKAQKVTVGTLAQCLGVSYSTAQRRLAGTHAWEPDDLVKAADLLGVSVNYLILGEEDAA